MPYFEVTYTDGTVDEIEADECTPRLWGARPGGFTGGRNRGYARPCPAVSSGRGRPSTLGRHRLLGPAMALAVPHTTHRA
jgi:hypothetical protein